MQKIQYLIIALLCAVAQGAWAADYNVGTADELRSAIESEATNITLTDNITVDKHLTISREITINLGGFTLSGNSTASTSSESFSCIFVVSDAGNLTLSNGTLADADNSATPKTDLSGGAIVNKGTATLTNVNISNCKGSYGGAICNYGTVTFEGGTITGCTGSSYGGAVYVVSDGTFTMTGGVITDCTGDDGGAIYIQEGGTVTMSGGSIKNCTSVNHSGGAINNHGTCTVCGGTITGNRAKNYGGGVYTSKSITMSGKPYIKDNEGSNLYLDGSSTKINCGAFRSGAKIGVSQSDYDSQSFAPSYFNHNKGIYPTTIFSADVSGFEVELVSDVPYIQVNGRTYIECSWSGGNTDGHVVKTKKAYTGSYTTYNSNTSVSSLSSGWYLLYSTFTFSKRVTISCDVKFILANGCNVEFDKGIYIPKDNKLTIYAEGDGDNMGYLWTEGSDGENGSIGGNEDNCGGHLVIHGGKIYAKPGSNNSAGIGGGDGSSSGMQSVTIYDGNITAEGKSSGPGIGGGQENSTSPSVTIYLTELGEVYLIGEDYIEHYLVYLLQIE